MNSIRLLRQGSSFSMLESYTHMHCQPAWTIGGSPSKGRSSSQHAPAQAPRAEINSLTIKLCAFKSFNNLTVSFHMRAHHPIQLAHNRYEGPTLGKPPRLWR